MPRFKPRLTAPPRMPFLYYHSDCPEACLTLRSGVVDLTMRAGDRVRLRVPVLFLTFSSAIWCRALGTVLLLSLRSNSTESGCVMECKRGWAHSWGENECLYLLTHNMQTYSHTYTWKHMLTITLTDLLTHMYTLTNIHTFRLNYTEPHTHLSTQSCSFTLIHTHVYTAHTCIEKHGFKQTQWH